MGTKKINLSNVLFSKVQQRVLGLLYSQPDSDFYTNEIIRLSKSGTGAVLRELEKYSKAGLVTLKIVGNQKRYQANRALPFFTELRSIILKTFGLADVLKQALHPFSKQIPFAFIYGSIATQEDIAHSDVDLMILSDTITYAELFPQLEKYEVQLGRRINPTFYSLSEWKRKYKAGNNFIIQTTKKPKIFLIGSEDELIKFR